MPLAAIAAVASIASAGVGIAGAAGAFSPDAPNAGRITRDSLQAQLDLAPQLYRSRSIYDPAYAGLARRIRAEDMFGDAGTPGLLGVMEVAAPRLADIGALYNTKARTADIGDVSRLGPAALAALRDYNPQVTGALDTMTASTQERFDAARRGEVDPFTLRAWQQAEREAQSARGFGTGQNDAAAEANYLAAGREQRYQTALGNLSATTGQAAGYYGDPFTQILARGSGRIATPGVPGTTTAPSTITNPALSPETMYQVTNQANQAGSALQQGYLSSVTRPGFTQGLLNNWQTLFPGTTAPPETGDPMPGWGSW